MRFLHNSRLSDDLFMNAAESAFMIYKNNNSGIYFNRGILLKGDRRIGFHVIEKKLFVSINGSTTFKDWLKHLDPRRKNFMGICFTNKSWVDEFDSIWNSIYDSMSHIVLKEKIESIVFVGHSYGGVLANLLRVKSEMLMLNSDDDYINHLVITFGCPGIHNTVYYDENIFDIYDFDDISRCWIVNRFLSFVKRTRRFSEDYIIIDDYLEDYSDRVHDHKMKTYYETMKKINSHRK